MKWTLFICIILLGCENRKLSSEKVPSIVLNTFKSKFPVSEKVEWEKTDSLYEADVDINDSIEAAVRIDHSGKLVMEKLEIPVNQVLPQIVNGFTNIYKDKKIDEIEKIIKDGRVYYQVELKGKEAYVFFTSDGKEIKNLSVWD